jgi:hypothetical protein
LAAISRLSLDIKECRLEGRERAVFDPFPWAPSEGSENTKRRLVSLGIPSVATGIKTLKALYII